MCTLNQKSSGVSVVLSSHFTEAWVHTTCYRWCSNYSTTMDNSMATRETVYSDFNSSLVEEFGGMIS